MKIAKVVATVAFLAMTAVLVYAFLYGDFMEEGSRLVSMPWGIVSLVDLYAGFCLFSCWIVYREKKLLPSVFWVLMMMVLGFWAGALYTMLALWGSRGDWESFWSGRRGEN